MAIKKADYMWIDGELVAWDEVQLPFLTHTFHYGLGVFEGIRAYESAQGAAIFRLPEHMKRLLESAHMCQLEVPYTADDFCKASVDLLRANGQRSAYLRPVIWFGADMGLGLGTLNEIRCGIAAFEWGAYLGDEGLSKGIRTQISSFPRRIVHGVPTKGKINGAYVGSILAKRQAVLAGYDEAIMLDAQGYISEASAENIFMVKDGVLWTPPTTSAILAGITRDTVLQIARDMGLPIEERSFTRDQLYVADECFLTGTAAEVTPVREVDNRQIGAGSMGPITQQIQSTYFRIVRGEESKYRKWLTLVEG